MIELFKEHHTSLKVQYVLIALLLLFNTVLMAQTHPADLNGDGTLDIMVIGTSLSIKTNSDEFSPYQISSELSSILNADTALSLNINVVAEDIYKSKLVATGIANQSTSTKGYYCHSLAQYYYWPDNHSFTMSNLEGKAGTDWDFVIIGADPYTITHIPGYYSLGVNKIADKVAQGGGRPLVLMPWARDSTLINHFEEFTYRTADGGRVPMKNIPAGLAWDALPAHKQDVHATHPSPNGAYLSAASIYAHIFNKSASSSVYTYDDSIADIAWQTSLTSLGQTHYTGNPSFVSPYKDCGIADQTLIYNHGGTSTENGILGGLQWVVNEAQKTIQFGATAPIHFNYGRSSMGSTHLYDVDTTKYNYTFGYPLQDDKSTGLVTMQYGLDQRVNESDVETDLGVALNMVRNSELPSARNVPLRTLISRMLEEIPGVAIYADPWHLSSDVNKAIGSYMYTMLTSDCALAGDTTPTDSAQWRTWMAHKVGYETAWNLMYLKGQTPCFGNPLSVKAISTEEIEFLVYPNPSNGNFTIDLGEYVDAGSAYVMDMMGRQIQQKSFTNKKLIQMSFEEPPGVYLLVVRMNDTIRTSRLVRQ